MNKQFLLDNGWMIWEHGSIVPELFYSERYHNECIERGDYVEAGYGQTFTWFALPLDKAVIVTMRWINQNDMDKLINEK
jgi:hypothetical protein